MRSTSPSKIVRMHGRAHLASHVSRRHLLLLFCCVASDGDGAAAAGAGATYDSGICDRSIPCGDHVDIKYPFYLSNTTGLSRCGYPGLGIICDDGGRRAILSLGNHNYTVLEINHVNHTVTVADSDVLDGTAGGGDCPRVRHNVTLPPVLAFTAPNNDSIAFFFDCNSTADAVQRLPPYIRPIICSSFEGQDSMPSLVAAQPDVADETEWFGLCKEVVVAHVFKNWLVSKEYWPKLGDDGYGALLKRGFQMSWDPTAGMCYGCEQSGGRCSYGSENEFLGCLCPNGIVRHSYCAVARQTNVDVAEHRDALQMQTKVANLDRIKCCPVLNY